MASRQRLVKITLTDKEWGKLEVRRTKNKRALRNEVGTMISKELEKEV